MRTSFRRSLAAAGAVSLLALTAACSTDAAAGPGADSTADPAIQELVPAEIADAGVLRIASSGDNPPFESLSEEDGETFVGLDPDLARAMGALMGLEVEFVPTSFDALIPALQAGTADAAMNSIGDTKEREEVVDFVTYYHNGTTALVEAGNPLDLEAGSLCGVRVGVVRGSLQQNDMLPQQAEACTAAGEEAPSDVAFAATPDSLLALQSGQIDTVLADIPVLTIAAEANDDFELAGPSFKNPNPGGVALPKGSELAEAVRAALAELMENGTYAEIMAEYSLEDIAIDEPVINGANS